jgi:hypothetical protein
MNCARDRLLHILAERAASLHGLPAADRPEFIAAYVSEWRSALALEYAGETVRVTTERIPRETRADRDRRILASAGQPARAVAEREHVSLRHVLYVRRAAQKPA